MRKPHHKRPSAAGFTLIEVLLVLVIMGMIMVAMTQILTAARTTRDTIHNLQEARLAGPTILDAIERDLRGLMIWNRDETEHLRVIDRVMSGIDGDSIDFITTTDSLASHDEFKKFLRTDVNEVGYRLRPNPDLDDFLEIYRREDAGVDSDPFDGGTYTFLHDRVKGFSIELFTEDGPDTDPVLEWGEEAASSNPEAHGLPARIEITLTLELAERLNKEQIRFVPQNRKLVTYERVIRIPQGLRLAKADMPVPMVPTPVSESGGTNASGAALGGTETSGRDEENMFEGGGLGDFEGPSGKGGGLGDFKEEGK